MRLVGSPRLVEDDDAGNLASIAGNEDRLGATGHGVGMAAPEGLTILGRKWRNEAYPGSGGNSIGKNFAEPLCRGIELLRAQYADLHHDENLDRNRPRIGAKPVDDRHAGIEFALEYLLRRQALDRHDQRAQRIAVRRDQHALAREHIRLDVVHVIGQRAGQRIFQAFAAGRRHIIGAAPDMDLLFAPFLARVVLVEAGQIAIIALVQGLVA